MQNCLGDNLYEISKHCQFLSSAEFAQGLNTFNKVSILFWTDLVLVKTYLHIFCDLTIYPYIQIRLYFLNKTLIFSYFFNDKMPCGYSWEVSRWGASNEHHNIFLQRVQKDIMHISHRTVMLRLKFRVPLLEEGKDKTHPELRIKLYNILFQPR